MIKMKTTLMIILLLFTVLVSACTQPPQNDVACSKDAKVCPDGSSVVRIPPDCEFEQCPESQDPIAKEQPQCTADEDCIRGGCSGTICQSKDAERIFTTCEYREEYACYQYSGCGCSNGRCGWQPTSKFTECFEEAKKNPAGQANEVIV
jgi:eight-cysteine-cluster-containing protein